jgi:lysophospholipase L1-like esterase
MILFTALRNSPASAQKSACKCGKNNEHLDHIMFSLSRAFSFVLLSTLLLLGVGRSRADEAAPFYLHDGDKVVFYGDSITDQRLYTTLTETFVVTRFPHLKVNFVDSGWGGDRVTGGGGGPIELRLQRDVFAYSPTVVTIMLGMNDGSYTGFNQAIADTYEHGYEHIVDELQSKLPGVRLTLIQPSPFDDITRPPNFEGGYNAVLEKYSTFVGEVAAKNKQTTTDFNTPVNAMLTKAKAADPQLATTILPDRVHPSPAGHLIMTEALLKTWNAPGLVSEVEIDAAAPKVALATNTQVSDLKVSGPVSWTQNDECLPMPVDAKDPAVALVLKSSDWVDALDREPLRVTGLKSPFYELDIDDATVGVFSNEDLAKGINLALLDTPMSSQAAEVHRLTLQHNDLHFNRWRVIQVPLESKNVDAITKSLPPILDALDAEERGVIDQQRAAAQPRPHHYELTPQETAGEPVGVVTPDPTMPAGLGPNLALHKNYVSSNPNAYGWDGGLTDGSWVAAAGTTYATDDHPEFPKTVTIDLEKPESIGYVLVGVPPFGATKEIVVSLSTDNQTFTRVGACVFPQNAAVKHLYTFPATQARYIRLTYPNHYDATVQYPPNYVFTTEVEAYAPVGK